MGVSQSDTTQSWHLRQGLADRPQEGEYRVTPTSRWWDRIFFAVVCVLVVAILYMPLVIHSWPPSQHNVYLAHSLIRGQLNVDSLPSEFPDWVDWHGHKYLPFGPLPAILLIPILPLLDLGVPVVWAHYLLTLLNIFVFYKILGRIGIVDERRKWALLLFFGGTVYLPAIVVGDASYLLAQIVTATFLLLAIYEALGRKRAFLIGLYVGLAAMTRTTLLFALPFFLWLMWRAPGPTNENAQPEQRLADRLVRALPSVGLVGVGLLGPVLLLLVYNYVRFGNPLESGYSMAVLGQPSFYSARSYGLFSLAHIPKNLFMMLLQGPLPYPGQDAPVLEFPYVVPSPWGMGLFYTSPALIYAFRAFRQHLRQPLFQACWLGIIFTMIPIVTYYGIGLLQFGYRYALDFLPFLLVLAAQGFPRPMTNLCRGLILLSTAICLWGSLFLLSWT